jgi:hypothetical protein
MTSSLECGPSPDDRSTYCVATSDSRMAETKDWESRDSLVWIHILTLFDVVDGEFNAGLVAVKAST